MFLVQITLCGVPLTNSNTVCHVGIYVSGDEGHKMITVNFVCCINEAHMVNIIKSLRS